MTRQRLMDWFLYQIAPREKTFWILGLLPTLCCLFGFALEILPQMTYLIYKGSMFFLPFLALRFRKEMRPSWKGLTRGLSHGLILCIVPLLFLSMDGLSLLNTEAIREKLIRLGILPHFILVILFLSFINAFLEEWYFRGLLGNLGPHFKDGRDKALVLAFLFASHHFIVLICYFDLFWSGLFTLGTAVAGYAWTRLRQGGADIFTLFVSHCLCDLVILGLGGWLLLFG